MAIGELIGPQTQAFRHFSQSTFDASIKGVHGLYFTPQLKSLFLSTEGIQKMASVLGFDNGFVLAGWIVLAGIPLCLMLKNSHGKIKRR